MVVAAFNQEKALVGAFSVITNLRMQLFEALEHGDHQLRHGRSPGAGEHGEEAFELIEHFDKSHCADKYHDDDFVTAILRQVRVTCATCVT